MHKSTFVFSLLIVAALSATIAFAGGNGAEKFELLGPNGDAFCDGSGVISGTAGGYGFAVINASSDGSISATVSLKGLKPNTEYYVRLIQGFGDCWTDDGSVTTNGQGNATVHVSEASVSTHAVIAVDELGWAGGNTFFVTETYGH